ncbi:MAG: hypothetical protein K2N69_00070, partial [Helicobacter sp.]|nr:hypothetical protein [Helicobacter sp.]
AYGSNIAAVRCGWEDRIMSNGESKIAESKAALCYGFAIALRALFLGILRFYCHCERVQRAWQSTVCEARVMKILCRSIASLTLAMTIARICSKTQR